MLDGSALTIENGNLIYAGDGMGHDSDPGKAGGRRSRAH